MNKLEYILGDLVMTDGVPLGTAKDVVYIVTSSDPSKTLKLDYGTVLKGSVCLDNIEGTEIGDKGYLFCDCCAWVDNIVPIPLTPEILEKNGWKLHKHHERNSYDDVSWSSYHKPAETNISLRFYQEEKAFFLFLYEQEISETPIRYIHQLQHLLFGLGINHEMNVYI
jgi:hypothetical protein